MNFKKIAFAVSLALAAGASFASDIELSAADELDGAAVTEFADTSLGGDGADSNNAVIFQGAGDHIAFIEQNGTAASIAVIVQTADEHSIAYINQSGTDGAVAVIFQR